MISHLFWALGVDFLFRHVPLDPPDGHNDLDQVRGYSASSSGVVLLLGDLENPGQIFLRRRQQVDLHHGVTGPVRVFLQRVV